MPERGSGTVRSVALMIVLAAVFTVVLQIGFFLQARHWAHAGADLGAIAAAETLAEGASEAGACERAAAVAQANRTALTACNAVGENVRVRTSSPVRGFFPSAQAEALAGPERGP